MYRQRFVAIHTSIKIIKCRHIRTLSTISSVIADIWEGVFSGSGMYIHMYIRGTCARVNSSHLHRLAQNLADRHLSICQIWTWSTAPLPRQHRFVISSSILNPHRLRWPVAWLLTDRIIGLSAGGRFRKQTAQTSETESAQTDRIGPHALPWRLRCQPLPALRATEACGHGEMLCLCSVYMRSVLCFMLWATWQPEAKSTYSTVVCSANLWVYRSHWIHRFLVSLKPTR